MTADDIPPSPARLPVIGHAARLGVSRRELFLVMAHLLVLAFAFEDEAIAEALVAWLGWNGDWAAVVRHGVIVAVLALWGALTLAWVRCRRDGS